MKDSYSHKGQEKLPEPRSEPCEEERVVNKPYEKPTKKEIGFEALSKEIGK